VNSVSPHVNSAVRRFQVKIEMTDSVNYTIRPALSSDEPFLREMFYQALHVEGQEPYPREVLDRPKIAKYIRDWGRAGDLGFIAVDSNNLPIGAIWCRVLNGEEKGFAYIDDETPELGIAVSPEHRSKGIGTALIKWLLEAAESFYPAIALSVSPNNRAIELYERLGFETVDVRETFPVMRRKLSVK
jgi:ribosomal protein S18 acetylase RimI-like enzyme